MTSKLTEPKDLGVKIGSPAMVRWSKVLEQTRQAIDEGDLSNELNAVICAHAEKRLAEEKEKFK